MELRPGGARDGAGWTARTFILTSHPDTVPALEYHHLTKHRPGHPPIDDPRIVQGFRPMLWELKPPQFKTYPGHDSTPLPESIEAGTQFDVAALGRLLFLSAGVVRVMPMGGRPMWFRAAGSAGNLSPLEVYVVTGDVPGLDGGVYHYEPVEHALTRLAGVPAATPPAIVVTGVPWRTSWKYRERGFRHLWWDAGTMLAQTLAVAEEMRLPAQIELGFVDSKVAALVGATPPAEVPLAVVSLAESSQLPDAGDAQDMPAGHLADRWVEFPLGRAVFQGSVLADADHAQRWRSAAASLDAAPAPGRAGDWAPPGHLDEVIRRRGSTREFSLSDVAPAEALTGALSWSTQPVPGDFVPPGRTLLEHNLTVHAVEGVDPGAYRWEPPGLQQLAAGDLRTTARHLCLDQALGGGGAYTAFHCADLTHITSVAGDRGYRAALLEAGVVEGRLHLAAYSLGYGATGLTFYDEEVTSFFQTSAEPMLVTAVGRPNYRSRAGGLPRRPLEMKRG